METKRQPKFRNYSSPGILLVAAIILVGSGIQVRGERVEAVGPQANADHATVWSGAYTDPQAAEGREVYNRACVECHGANLEGEDGPALIGDRFMESWREDTVGSLYSDIRRNMPRRRPPLSDPEYLVVTTFLLQANGFPAGSEALSPDNFSNYWIEKKTGPEPLPTNSLVKVVGCMTAAGGNEWDLTMATLPVRDRNPDPDEGASPEDLASAKDLKPGTEKFRLLNFFMLGMFEPGQFEGKKMLAKGALRREPGGNQISLTSLDVAAESCR